MNWMGKLIWSESTVNRRAPDSITRSRSTYDSSGNAASWSDTIYSPDISWYQAGGAAIADIDKNGSLDLLLLAIDNPHGTD